MAPFDYPPRPAAPAPYIRAPPPHPAHQMNINYGVQQQFRAPYPVQQMNRGYGIQQPMVAPHVQHFTMQHMNDGQVMCNASGTAPQKMPLVNAYDVQYQQQRLVAPHAPAHPVARQEVIEVPDDEDEVQFVSAAPRTTPQSLTATEATPDWTARLPPAPAAQIQPEWAENFSMRKYNALAVSRVFGVKNSSRSELSQEDQELLGHGQQMAKEATQQSKARRAEAEKRERERKKNEAEAEAKRRADLAQQAKEKAQQEQKMRLQQEKAAEEERRKKMAAARPVANRGGLFLPNMRTQANTGAATTTQQQQSQTQPQTQQKPAPATSRPSKTWTPTCSTVQALTARRCGPDNASIGITFQSVPNITTAFNGLGLRHGFAHMRLYFHPNQTFLLEVAGSLQPGAHCWTYEDLYRNFGFANADQQDKWRLPDFSAVPTVDLAMQPTVESSYEPFQTTSGCVGFSSKGCAYINDAINLYRVVQGSEQMQLIVSPNYIFTVRIHGRFGTESMPATLDQYKQSITKMAEEQGKSLATVDDIIPPRPNNAQQRSQGAASQDTAPHAAAKPMAATSSATPTVSGGKRRRTDTPTCNYNADEPHAKRTRLDDQETTLAGPASQPAADPLSAKAASKRKITDEPEADSPVTKRSRFEPDEADASEDRRDSGYGFFQNSPNQVETSDGPDDMEAELWAALNEYAPGSQDDGGLEAQRQAALAEDAPNPQGDNDLEAQLHADSSEDAPEPNGNDNSEAQPQAASDENTPIPSVEPSQVVADDEVDSDVDWDELFGSAGQEEQHEVVATNDDEELFGPSDRDEQSEMNKVANASPQASTTESNDFAAVRQVSEAPLEDTAHAEEPSRSAVYDETGNEAEEANSDSESEYDSEEEDDEETAGAKLQYPYEIAALKTEIEDRKKFNITCTNNILKQRNLAKIADNKAKLVLKRAALAELSKNRPEDVAEDDAAEDDVPENDVAEDDSAEESEEE